MRLLIAAVGRLKAGPERELLDRYVERANAAGRAVSLGPLEISEVAESQDRRPQDRMADEARKLDITVQQFALGSGLQPSDSRDQEPHRALRAQSAAERVRDHIFSRL